MRWAVRRLRGMSHKHRMLFEYDSFRRKMGRLRNQIDLMRREMYGEDPWAAPMVSGTLAFTPDEEDAYPVLDNHPPLA
ncbi:MAG: hypothetical protein IH822_06315 [Chloroflexi bacterium]|nr:hypothetical protein [Chloroflexota bacterium]